MAQQKAMVTVEKLDVDIEGGCRAKTKQGDRCSNPATYSVRTHTDSLHKDCIETFVCGTHRGPTVDHMTDNLL